MGVEKLAHPYFPTDLHLPHYKPNEKEILELLVPFFGFVAVVIGLTWLYTGKVYYFKDVLNVYTKCPQWQIYIVKFWTRPPPTPGAVIFIFMQFLGKFG